MSDNKFSLVATVCEKPHSSRGKGGDNYSHIFSLAASVGDTEAVKVQVPPDVPAAVLRNRLIAAAYIRYGKGAFRTAISEDGRFLYIWRNGDSK